MNRKQTTYMGRVSFREDRRLFGILEEDRFSHMYVIGKTGTGKSTLLRTMAAQDLANGNGFALFDPHGDLVESLLPLIPKWRANDVTYLNVPDRSQGWNFNPFAGVRPDDRSRAAAGIVEVFKKMWPDDWGPRLEHLLRNVAWTLLETPGGSFGDVPRLLADKDFRRSVVSRIENEEVRAFWRDEFERYSPGFRAVVTAPLQNKLGALLTDPLLRSILGSSASSLDLRQLMDQRKVLLVNLSRGRMGEGPSSIVGSLLVASLSLCAFRRAELPMRRRLPFTIFLDEFQSFATLSLVSMLAELRKYKVGLAFANQYASQIDPDIRDAVLGNAGTLVAFRLGAVDSESIARELNGEVRAADLVRLPNFRFFTRQLIDGEVTKTFSATTIRIDGSTTFPSR